MTQFILGLNGALIVIQGSVVTLTSLNDEVKALIVIACSAAIAMLNPWLPKVSEAIRRVMELQRRG